MLPTSGRAALFDLVLCRYQVKSSGCASFICLLEMEVAGAKASAAIGADYPCANCVKKSSCWI
jgi:hypothetical protein